MSQPTGTSVADLITAFEGSDTAYTTGLSTRANDNTKALADQAKADASKAVVAQDDTDNIALATKRNADIDALIAGLTASKTP